MKTIKSGTIGEAWIESCSYIEKHGKDTTDDGEILKEVLHLSIMIDNPSSDDPVIEKHGDKKMIGWMLSNFMEQKIVPELKNSPSYGTRLFNLNGKNQISWVTEQLKKKPESKSATISMLMAGCDTGYIPCVSMLDFKIRNGSLMLTALCRSIDFGKKVYANMIALHKIQKMVADSLNTKTGPLVLHIVSAHIYYDDFESLKEILKDNN